MKAALCLIGTELTRGIIQDTHTKLIASTLSSLMIEVLQVTLVPDDGTIETVISSFLHTADVILCTGGLGPTSDDITRDAIARLAGVDLVEDPEALAQMERMIRRPAGDANRRQVCIPRGFTILQNPLGTAPGFFGRIGESVVYCMPGPPRELERMFLEEVVPRITTKGGVQGDEILEASTFLIPESRLEELCRVCADSSLRWATRVQTAKISLYIRGGSEVSRTAMISRMQEHAGKELVRMGSVTPAESLISTCMDMQGMCVFAESCTGGMISKELTDVPGSSGAFWGSFVTYADEAKRMMLGVSAQTLAAYGAVSRETVLEMAEGALSRSQAHVSCSVSGIAGPEGGSPGKPVGTVWFGFASHTGRTAALQWVWGYPRRDLIRRRATAAALLLTETFLKGCEVLDTVSQWQYSDSNIKRLDTHL